MSSVIGLWLGRVRVVTRLLVLEFDLFGLGGLDVLSPVVQVSHCGGLKIGGVLAEEGFG